jgi:hypothetical protein
MKPLSIQNPYSWFSQGFLVQDHVRRSFPTALPASKPCHIPAQYSCADTVFHKSLKPYHRKVLVSDCSNLTTFCPGTPHDCLPWASASDRPIVATKPDPFLFRCFEHSLQEQGHMHTRGLRRGSCEMRRLSNGLQGFGSDRKAPRCALRRAGRVNDVDLPR